MSYRYIYHADGYPEDGLESEGWQVGYLTATEAATLAAAGYYLEIWTDLSS